MSDKLKRTIIGAVIAVALAAGVSYGLISQQTADQIRQKADQTLATDQPSTSGQPAPERNGSDTPPPAPTQPDRQTEAPASRP